MTAEEELISLRQENQALRERARLQQETIDLQQTVIEQQQRLIEGLHQQTEWLAEQVQALQERLKQDSHNSHLPPSSDRFHRQPKSLRKRSGKKAGGQYWLYLCQHALCNVHHLRDLTFLEEEQQQAWAAEMKALLLDSKAAVVQARALGRTSLHPLEVADWKACYAALLAEGYQANPPDSPPEISKKGRRKQSAARNLLDRFSKHQEAVLAFLDTFAVPFDKSLAERDLRMVKVQQKVSGCFRSASGAVAFCRIRGYLSTLRKQGLALLTALEQALVGHPVSPTF